MGGERMVTDERRREVEKLARSIAAWAVSRPDVRAVAVVGSWARQVASTDSDLDVVVLTDRAAHYLDVDDWIESAVGEPAIVTRRMAWGPLLSERRVLLRSGLEVEFGFAPLSWASTRPVDPGTAVVVRDALWPLVDLDGVLDSLRMAVG
ncbi:MAG: aminoglycoside 6-adenylyltransferase [Acidimicrobiales bacterium]